MGRLIMMASSHSRDITLKKGNNIFISNCNKPFRVSLKANFILF
jgi:hypothetical protein